MTCKKTSLHRGIARYEGRMCVEYHLHSNKHRQTHLSSSSVTPFRSAPLTCAASSCCLPMVARTETTTKERWGWVRLGRVQIVPLVFKMMSVVQRCERKALLTIQLQSQALAPRARTQRSPSPLLFSIDVHISVLRVKDGRRFGDVPLSTCASPRTLRRCFSPYNYQEPQCTARLGMVDAILLTLFV